ncbi:hypothetical protein PE067_09140 [Paracoccus sp. DMF-8]|uniref:hypothetical protein n=1 Tax=Paracoccus sp. DMF-8 TaxID=3019445 RepID=UPI0023E758A9|nr:hypothetical protein [Paracoccus sp. DMF-8]MDF3606282.1 hypothetical protein [Paracoccus sp. DMF-8]
MTLNIQGCAGKVAYRTPQGAWDKLIRSEKKPIRRLRKVWVKPEHREVYRCEVCGLYHLGRPA